MPIMFRLMNPTPEMLECCEMTPFPTSVSIDSVLWIILYCLPAPEASVTEDPFAPKVIQSVIDMLSSNAPVFSKYVGAAERNKVLRMFREGLRLVPQGITSKEHLEQFRYLKEKLFTLLCGGPAMVYPRDMDAYLLYLERHLERLSLWHSLIRKSEYSTKKNTGFCRNGLFVGVTFSKMLDFWIYYRWLQSQFIPKFFMCSKIKLLRDKLHHIQCEESPVNKFYYMTAENGAAAQTCF